MVKKLAIVISGAVSLGSYEAGVMYEVLEAIAKHNESVENEEEHIEIDVITGASAGGMTACILAQHLICGDQPPQNNPTQSLREPYNNPLYNAWVKDVDIRQLLEVDLDNQKFSLLQTSVVEEIGKRYLKDRPQLNAKHPAAASEIYVGIAMSNLSGYNFFLETEYERSSQDTDEKEGTSRFAYTRYKDQFVCMARRHESGDLTLSEIDRETIRDPKINQEFINWKEFRNTNWTELREVGLSSGAFPFAFQVRNIKRFGGLSKRSNRQGNYLYTDGGVFENEPIGMAKFLVDQIDRNRDSNDKRYYLYIAPGQRELPENSFNQENGNLLKTGITLLSSIFHQARFQDWIMEDMDAPVFFITASNFELIGDVFSAFAGFLEEKFRAYDYNIGRERSQYEMSDSLAKSQLQDLLKSEADKMPPIQWTVNCKIDGKNLQDWTKVKNELSKLAKPLSKNGKRDQLAELRELMTEVDEETRKEILKQLTSRLESLIDLINDYLGEWDLINDGSIPPLITSLFKFNLREKVGKPMTKLFLKQALKYWLEKNVLNFSRKAQASQPTANKFVYKYLRKI